MGKAVDKKPLTSRPEMEAAAAAAAAAAAELGTDFLKFLDDTFPDDNGEDDKQGDKEGGEVKEEEEEEELDWICNSELFPPLDISLLFGPTDTSDALKVLEDVVVDEMDINGVEEGEAGKAMVPKKRRSPMERRPRLVFTNHPSQWVVQNEKEKQTSVRSCTHCGATKTPQWRQGPEGPSTLCNACGVRYNSGRLFDEYRPANSPTFCPKSHSNIHRKVVEIRGAKQTDGGLNASMNCRPQSRFGGNELGGEPDDGGSLGT